MTYEKVLPIWNALRVRFLEKAKALTDEDLTLQLGDMSIGNLLYHTGEVEYIFADWFFEKSSEETGKPSLSSVDELVAYLEASNQFLQIAMKELPEASWNEVKETQMGPSTPLEAVGRLMYHAGIHAGQITDIKKFGE